MEEENLQTKVDPTVEELLKQIEEMKLKTVDKDTYEKMVENNKKLVNEIANNRTPIPEDNKGEPTRADIIERCKKRTNGIEGMSSMDQVNALVSNYRDMKLLGMETEGVEERDVQGLEKILEEAKGDERLFKSLLQSRIKETL